MEEGSEFLDPTLEGPSASATQSMPAPGTIYRLADGGRPPSIEFDESFQLSHQAKGLKDGTVTQLATAAPGPVPTPLLAITGFFRDLDGYYLNSAETSPVNEQGPQPPHAAAGDGYAFRPIEHPGVTSAAGAEALEDRNEKVKSQLLNQYLQDDTKPEEPDVLTRAALMTLLVQTLDNNTKALRERAREIGIQETKIRALEAEVVALQQECQDLVGSGVLGFDISGYQDIDH